MADPSTGRFCWHELVTTDLAAATKFYGELLDWTFRDNPSPGGGTYRMFSLGETMVGGAMVAPAGVPSGWLVYVAVDDTDCGGEESRRARWQDHGAGDDGPGHAALCVRVGPARGSVRDPAAAR